MLRLFLSISWLVTAAIASWAGNLNFRSPSERHPALGVALPSVVKRQLSASPYGEQQLNFTHGIASGDPYPHSVILWTRASPLMDDDRSNITVSGTARLFSHETEQYVHASKSPVCVQWKVSTSHELSDTVTSGQAYTSSDIDYTIKVEAKGLNPFTTYYYQFNICGSKKVSPIGRTKTSPTASDKTSEIALAVYSCSNYPFGYFGSVGNPARKDSVDYVIHLGDYIYEYANGDYGDGTYIGRVPQPTQEIFTLYDYRRRLATYREDLDMLLSHQSFAWIPVWDDHEVADNTWRDGSSGLNNTEDSFIKDGGVSVDQRKMNAVRAYFEWMPIRQVDMDDNLRIWRTFSLGSLMDLIMLDTRQYDRSITDLYWNTDYVHEISNDVGRSLMGSHQENWFYNSLSESAKRGATWRIIGSQIVFSRLNESFDPSYGDRNPFDYDAWDGYEANRNRTLAHLYNNNIGNNIFIAGDSHVNWVSDVTWLGNEAFPYDSATGAGSIGAEFAGTAITSPSPYGQNISLVEAGSDSRKLLAANKELQWQESYYRGYFELRVGQEKVDASFFGVPTALNRNPYEIPLANFTVKSGANRLSRPVAGGTVENGALQRGMTHMTNLTNDTSVPGGRWFISHAGGEVQ